MKQTSMVGYKSLLLLGLVLSASMVLPVPAYADEVQDLEGQVERIDKASKETGVAQPDIEAVSKATGVPVSELKRQQGKTKMGTGSLLIANSLATKTGKSFDDIMAAKASGKGWGQIAKDSNVKLGPLLKEAKQVCRAQTNSKAAKGASDKVSNGKKTTNQSVESNASQAKGQGGGGKSGDGSGKGKR